MRHARRRGTRALVLVPKRWLGPRLRLARGAARCHCGAILTRPTPGRFSSTHRPTDCLAIIYPGRALFPGGDGETPCAKIRSDGVRGGSSWRSRAATGPCGHTLAEAGVTPPMPYYFVNSLTRWPSSGRMSFSIARRTAFSEPGVEKSTRPLMMPAVARLMMAAEPIS